IAGSTWPVLDYELLAKPLREPLTHQACDEVGSAASRKADDDAHRPRAFATRDRAGSAAATVASCKNLRRGSSILNPPSRFTSFDHLVGAGEQRRRNFDAERLGGLEVDHQLVPGKCLHRQIGWLFALGAAAGGSVLSIEDQPSLHSQRLATGP